MLRKTSKNVEKRRKSGRNWTNFGKTPIFEATNSPELHNSSQRSCTTPAQFKFLSFCLLRMTHSNPNQIKLWMMTIYKDNLLCIVISHFQNKKRISVVSRFVGTKSDYKALS